MISIDRKNESDDVFTLPIYVFKRQYIISSDHILYYRDSMIFHINNWSLLLQRAMLLRERKNQKYKIVIARRNDIQ